jgi:heat-inducible transcriptional repressor
MLPESLTSEDAERINTEVRRASRQLDTVVEHASHVLSSVTRNIAFAIAPRLKSQQFKHVQLIWVGPRTVHIVLVTDLGLAAQTTIETESEVTADQLTRACNVLNAKLAGQMLSDVPYAVLRELASEAHLPTEVVTVLAQLFVAHTEAAIEKRLFAGGAHNLLDQQEFRDLRKLRAILDLLEEQRTF